MTTSKIDFSFNKVARLSDAGDLAELLFPGNRNQQHAFLVIWFSLKWSDHKLVPNLAAAAQRQGVPRRTFERVRAKLRRLGLIDHVSRFHATHAHRDDWVFSTRFERALTHLADTVASLKAAARSSRDKDLLLLHVANARIAHLSDVQRDGRTDPPQTRPPDNLILLDNR